MGAKPKYDWRGAVLTAAAEFVQGFATGVTLRQCFYFLVSRGIIENSVSDYHGLSHYTTVARDAGTFPDFIDNGRAIRRSRSFDDPDSAQDWLARIYRRDRTEFADRSLYLGVEKAGLAAQLTAAFGDLGLPILPLSGWVSQTFREQVRREIVAVGRPAVLIYAGDFDPAGVLIGDSFAAKVGEFDEYVRVGLNLDQLAGLPVNPFPLDKKKQPLIPRFVERYGADLEAMGLPSLVQFELDALPPDRLIAIYQEAIDRYFDESAYDEAIAQEEADRQELRERWTDV
jgi:hypothetical protein